MTLLIQGINILRNVSCSYATRVLALPDLLACLRSSVFRIIATIPSKSVQSMCHLGPLLLLLSIYDTGSSSCYILHGAGGRALIVFLMHSYVTLRISFGYGCTMCTQFIVILISSFHSFRLIIRDYTFCGSRPE